MANKKLSLDQVPAPRASIIALMHEMVQAANQGRLSWELAYTEGPREINRTHHILKSRPMVHGLHMHAYTGPTLVLGEAPRAYKISQVVDKKAIQSSLTHAANAYISKFPHLAARISILLPWAVKAAELLRGYGITTPDVTLTITQMAGQGGAVGGHAIIVSCSDMTSGPGYLGDYFEVVKFYMQ